MALDDTHDPALTSWVESANVPDAGFPIQNLPHGVFRRRGSREPFRGGVAIGDCILDIGAAAAQQVFAPALEETVRAASADALNGLMALGPARWQALRHALSRLLRTGAPEAKRLRDFLVPQAQAEYALPARVGDYTDFSTSRHHLANAGAIFQPGAPMPPHFDWLPIGYHGRSSTLEVSGAPVHRPCGQARAADGSAPRFGPTQQLDYELELALWVGPGNVRGRPIEVDRAEQHLFGIGLLNDWSARDLQAWEAMPLGPFLSKNFLTSVSPWIVTLAALEPFRCVPPRAGADALPHLRSARTDAGFDLQLEVWLQVAGAAAVRLSRSSFRHCPWSAAQLIAHHASGGCSLRSGDVLGTGTQSGPEAGEQGCLLELTRGGSVPLELPDGVRRGYLQDGDTVILRAWGERPGAARIGFGECRGTVLSAPNA